MRCYLLKKFAISLLVLCSGLGSTLVLANSSHERFYLEKYEELASIYQLYISDPSTGSEVIRRFEALQSEWHELYDNQYDLPLEQEAECRFWLAYRVLQNFTLVESKYLRKDFSDNAAKFLEILQGGRELSENNRDYCRYDAVDVSYVSLLRLIDEPKSFEGLRVNLTLFLKGSDGRYFGYFTDNDVEAQKRVRLDASTLRENLTQGVARVEGRVSLIQKQDAKSELVLTHTRLLATYPEEVTREPHEMFDPTFVSLLSAPTRFLRETIKLSGHVAQDYAGRKTLYLSSFHLRLGDSTNGIWLQESDGEIRLGERVTIQGQVTTECDSRHMRGPLIQVCLRNIKL